MSERIHRLDDIFTEILVGLALALLMAIGFAPATLGLAESEWHMAVSHSNAIHDYYLVEWPVPVDCPKCNSSVARPGHPCATCGFKSGSKAVGETLASYRFCPICQDPIQPGDVRLAAVSNHVAGWSIHGQFHIFLLWVLLAAFCVKIVHEQSVLRHHTEQLQVTDSRLELSRRGNVALFLCRVGLLISLYLVILIVFIRGHGELGRISSDLGFAMMLFAAYVFPDWILYRQLMDSRDRTRHASVGDAPRVVHWLLEEVVWKRITINFVTALVGVVLFFGAFGKPKSSAGDVVVASVVILLVGAILFAIVLPKSWSRCINDGWDAWIKIGRTRHRMAVFLLAFTILAFCAAYLAAKGIAPSSSTMRHQWAAIAILACMVVEWLANSRYYFGQAPSYVELGGIVLNRAGLPVENAKVNVAGAIITSDARGAFFSNTVFPGWHTIHVQHGQSTRRMRIKVSRHGHVSLRVELEDH